jgi:hypothetical protein
VEGKAAAANSAAVKESKPRTKVEVSNLPPGLSEEQFRAAANQTVNLDDCVDYFFYVAGKSRYLPPPKEEIQILICLFWWSDRWPPTPSSPCCSVTKRVKSYCVMNFKNPQDLFEFAQKFNGHLFVDTKGECSCCCCSLCASHVRSHSLPATHTHSHQAWSSLRSSSTRPSSGFPSRAGSPTRARAPSCKVCFIFYCPPKQCAVGG